MSDKNEQAVIESVKTVEQQAILTVRIMRHCETGLRIYLQSPLDWSLFAADKQALFTLGGVECRVPRSNKLPNVPGHFRADNVFDYDDYPNLCLLLAKNLQEGVWFDFGLMAISDDRLIHWAGNLKCQVKILYLTHLKPVNIEIQFTAATVEKESHA